MTLRLTFLLYLNGKYFDLKKNHSDIMDFQLQNVYSFEAVGKDVCMIRMCTGRNYSTYTITL